jgi:putative transposase
VYSTITIVVQRSPGMPRMSFSHPAGSDFAAVATGSGIRVLRTPFQAPRANAICERLLGSVRCEYLDHILLLSEAHLRRVLKEYVGYVNRSQPHQGINQHVPELGDTAPGSNNAGAYVVAFPILDCLHHEYHTVA